MFVSSLEWKVESCKIPLLLPFLLLFHPSFKLPQIDFPSSLYAVRSLFSPFCKEGEGKKDFDFWDRLAPFHSLPTSLPLSLSLFFPPHLFSSPPPPPPPLLVFSLLLFLHRRTHHLTGEEEKKKNLSSSPPHFRLSYYIPGWY